MSTSSPVSLSATGTLTLSSGSVATSLSSTFSASATVAAPEAFTSSRPAGGDGGNGGNGGGQNNGIRPLASSAALYLYTFLATLVLLLTVSAAIVIRSFVLRRRHRLMVEEAIRNGTWVPPTQQPRAPRVDLSKKPVMWEAHMSTNEKDISSGFYGARPYQLVGDDNREWDAIKPVSAAYLVPVKPSLLNVSKSGSHSTTATNQSSNPPTGQSRFGTARVGSLFRSIGRGVRDMLGFGPSSSMSVGANALTNSGTGNDGGMSEQGDRESPPTCGPDGGPPVVRVAVLIAMPQALKPGSPPVASSSSGASSSSSGAFSPADSHPLSPELQPITSYIHQRPPDPDDEEPLPVMEMGVAELVVVDHEAEARADALPSVNAKERLGRDSASLTVEV